MQTEMVSVCLQSGWEAASPGMKKDINLNMFQNKGIGILAANRLEPD